LLECQDFYAQMACLLWHKQRQVSHLEILKIKSSNRHKSQKTVISLFQNSQTAIVNLAQCK